MLYEASSAGPGRRLRSSVPMPAAAWGPLHPACGLSHLIFPGPVYLHPAQAVALLGSLLMPHNLYLHSALVQTRSLRAPDDAHRREALAYFGLESALSLGVRGRRPFNASALPAPWGLLARGRPRV